MVSFSHVGIRASSWCRIAGSVSTRSRCSLTGLALSVISSNSRRRGTTMPLNLVKFLQSGDHADVEFVVKPEKFGTLKVFKAHKQLLALSSEVFEGMFYGQLAEKDTVVITDLHPDGFYGLLKYVYAGQARIQNCFEALHTHAAAEKYLFEELASACLAYLH
ncbi:BTB/POZ domain-containing protein 3-like [Dermacentor andersoni]|uniref:BTB/POZ domain-containing protein 3-like n=1 Tax=Dermacentor andersoni TaxID=34620 RepID=UPI003B3A9678